MGDATTRGLHRGCEQAECETLADQVNQSGHLLGFVRFGCGEEQGDEPKSGSRPTRVRWGGKARPGCGQRLLTREEPMPYPARRSPRFLRHIFSAANPSGRSESVSAAGSIRTAFTVLFVNSHPARGRPAYKAGPTYGHGTTVGVGLSLSPCQLLSWFHSFSCMSRTRPSAAFRGMTPAAYHGDPSVSIEQQGGR